jgi:hypothetical protein
VRELLFELIEKNFQSSLSSQKMLGEIVVAALESGKQISLADLQKQFCKRPNHPQLEIEIAHHSLEKYNQLIPQNYQEIRHHA